MYSLRMITSRMAPILSSPAPGPLRLRPRALVGTRRESPGEKADCATGDGQPEILAKLSRPSYMLDAEDESWDAGWRESPVLSTLIIEFPQSNVPGQLRLSL